MLAATPQCGHDRISPADASLARSSSPVMPPADAAPAGVAPDRLPGPVPDAPPDSARDALPDAAPDPAPDPAPDAAAATEAGPDMGAPHVSQ